MSRRCARPGRQQSWVREGEDAGHPRGLRAGQVSTRGTRERGRAIGLLDHRPGVGDRVTTGPGVVLGASPRSRARKGEHEPREQARSRDASDTRSDPRGTWWPSSRRSVPGKVRNGDPRDPREGRRRRAACPTGGNQGRDFDLTNPDTSTPVDCGGSQRLCLRNRMRALRTYGSVGGPDG